MPPKPRRQAATRFLERVNEEFHGRLKAAWLFGSVARGDDASESDVDLLLVLDRRDQPTLRRIYTIAEELSIEFDVDLSLKVFDEEQYAANRDHPFVRTVESEGVALA